MSHHPFVDHSLKDPGNEGKIRYRSVATQDRWIERSFLEDWCDLCQTKHLWEVSLRQRLVEKDGEERSEAIDELLDKPGRNRIKAACLRRRVLDQPDHFRCRQLLELVESLAVEDGIIRASCTSSGGPHITNLVVEEFQERFRRETRWSWEATSISTHHGRQRVPRLPGITGTVRDERLPVDRLRLLIEFVAGSKLARPVSTVLGRLGARVDTLETPCFPLPGATSGIEPWCDRPVVLLDDHARSIPVDE